MVIPQLVTLGDWIAKVRAAGSIPPPATHAARLQLLNLVAAANASAGIPEIRSLFKSLPVSSGPATDVTTGAKMSTAAAAYVNACFSMAEDYDDIVWMGHTGHSAVFASLAVAEAQNSTFQELLEAIVVANEVSGRLGASCLFGPLNGQMWTFIHLIGAAAAASYLLGLDANQTAHALAISLSQPPFALQPGFFGPTSKFLTAATPTQTGVMAAYLARNGMTGSPSTLEEGFWSTFTFAPMAKMFSDLGDVWITESLSIKTFPVCHYYQTACEAVGELAQKRKIVLGETRRIVCKTTLPAQEVIRLAHKFETVPDLSPVGVSFDLGLALAVLLTAGRLTPGEASTPWLTANTAGVMAWYHKIQVVHSPELTLRVLDSANNLPSGRASMKSLGLLDLVRIARGFHKFGVRTPFKEIGPWIWALLKRLFHPSKAGAGLPLYFPNEVRIERSDGTWDDVRIDLPSGSIVQSGMEDGLRAKFLSALSPRLGDAGALDAFNAGMSYTTSVSDFVHKIS